MPDRCCVLFFGIIDVHLALRQRILKRRQKFRATPVVHHRTGTAAFAAMSVTHGSYGSFAREGRQRRA